MVCNNCSLASAPVLNCSKNNATLYLPGLNATSMDMEVRVGVEGLLRPNRRCTQQNISYAGKSYKEL